MKEPISIAIAEDDPDDRMMLEEAIEEHALHNDVYFTRDGQELLELLERRGDYAHLEDEPLPGIILLDLNMPRMSGMEVIRFLKNHERFRSIPIVVLTTSRSEADVLESYHLGINSYIPKPVTFRDLLRVIRKIKEYWLELVKLPPQRRT